MFFQSAGFLFVFLPVTLVALRLAPKGRASTVVLVALSYLFYSGGDPVFVALLFVSSVVDYGVALRVHATDDPRRRKAWLAMSIAINLGVLAAFKYGQMIVRNSHGLWAWLGLDDVTEEMFDAFILPAGISFYTFQSMSYTIDVYRRQVVPTRDFASFLGYVAYLPQLIAGPIERFNHLYPQLGRLAEKASHGQWSAGLDRLALGVVQKLLIADSCGRIVDRLAAWDGTYDLLTAWLGTLAFGMQIYYDFAGYTNMAIGISLMLGVRLSENFMSPYRARNIQDFWRRWHITLSRWFRDYVYFPLGGSRLTKFRTGLNLVLTMALCGLWHGAGWNYVAWGLGHGCLLAGFHGVKARFPRLRLPTSMAVLITFLCVHFLWVPFRFSDPVQVMRVWSGMLGLHGLGSSYNLIWDMVFIAVVTIATWVAPNCAQRWPGRSGSVESLAFCSLAMAAVLFSPQIHQFIYFRF